MSNVAIISFEASINKWVATFAGKILSTSHNKEQLITRIKTGYSPKANAANITDVRELETGEDFIVNEVTGEEEKVDRFGINERFDFLSEFVGMVADRTSASLLVTGEGGLGKTFTVNKAIKAAGLCDSSLAGYEAGEIIPHSESKKMFTVVKGYSTAKGLFRTLYENRDRIVIFDDCDSVLKDATALNILKGALDSYDRRIISWNAESFGDDGLPRSFEFTGGVIFISNLPTYKVDQAIRSRAICVDVSMTTDQKIERMAELIKSEDFMSEYEMTTKVAALEFMNRFKNQAKELSLRTLISVTKVASRGGEWERRAEYLMTAV